VFSNILNEEKISNSFFNINQISNSIKINFSFCWYQFYKFLFIFTNRWKIDTDIKDLETICVGLIVFLNAAQDKKFKNKNLDRKKYLKEIQKSNYIGINAFSIAEISGIPRATVVRKLKLLVRNKILDIDKRKLYSVSVNVKSKQFKVIAELQDKNMKALSKFLYRVFNQIKVINSK